MKQIEINDVKAIAHITIPIPEGGGVVVLQGANGCGKSTALDAIATAAGAKDRGLTARDGAKFGKVTAPGVTLRVGRSTTRAGELELQSVEGKHSVDKLVDPGFVDPSASDRARIRTLIQFAGVEPDIGIFSGIEGYDYAKDHVVESEDVLKIAASLKEEIEKLARSSENSAADAIARASLLYEQCQGIDSTVERDGDELRQAVEHKIRRLADTERLQRERQERRAQWIEAKSQLMTLETASESLDGAMLAEKQSREYAEQKRAELGRLQQEIAVANEQQSQSAKRLESIKKSHVAMGKLRESVNAGEPELIPDSQIDDLKQSVERARAAEQAGEIQRKKHIDRDGSVKWQQIAKNDTDEGKYYRAGAAKIDGILSEQINRLGVDLAVMNGRLYYDTSRGPTLYDELSAGERWRIALDIVIEIAGADSLLSIPQECWEAMDPANQMAIAKHCQSRGVALFTAEATDGELRYKMFSTE
jgi:energy-coupling factor transporter ATP-binding protein EcfA2